MVNSATRLAVLALLVAVGGMYHTVTIGTYQTAHSFSPDDLLAAFTAIESTYTGYARSTAVVWGTGYLDAADTAICVGDDKLFVCADAAVPQDVFGEFWVNAGLLVKQVIYPSPSPMRSAGQYVLVQPVLSYTA